MTPSIETIPVQSLDAPALHPYRTLRRTADHWNEGIFVAEGDKVVERLLASPIEVVSLLVTEVWLKRLLKTEGSGRLGSIPVYLAAKELMEEIVGFNLHQGIMAVGRVPTERPLDSDLAALPQHHLLVALDGLANAENVGVVVRNCAAFGVDAIIVGPTSSSPYLRRAVRNSMGTVFGMRIVHVADLPGALGLLHERFGTAILGTTPAGASTLAAQALTGNCCLVLGSEGDGIAPEVLERCTARVAIPMHNDTDSLNVASASAVVLYEARRQRDLPQ
jgi:tRNA G18 (ribose-2'-O)-methylase SpoU